MHLNRNLLLIYFAAFLRSFGVGLTAIILGIYISRLGFSATHIGMMIAAGLGGTALATLVVSFQADRLGRRRTLVVLSLLMTLGGLGLTLTTALPALLLLSFVGMLNGMGRDRGAAYALEQAIIPETGRDEHRTWALAWYNLVLSTGNALGALAGMVPFLLRRTLGVGLLDSYQFTFALYAALGIIIAILYASLSKEIEVTGETSLARAAAEISPKTKKTVTKLAALFGVDSLGGGFVSGALLAYWFFQRFDVAEESLGPLFFGARLLNSGSYLVAAWLGRRIGLLNTMVFTHIPSSLLLIAVPFAPSFSWAVALFLARECLVQMDVPTRQSYVLAVVRPNERTFASGITNLSRNVAWATAPSIAGYMMQNLALAAPLFVGGGVKIMYDLLLYRTFRRLKPPEEKG